MTSLGGQDSQPLDLSYSPLDLSVKRPISISEQINGVAHFSFALDKVAKDATDKENCDIDVEAWDDSLWNAKSVIKLAEILEDWKSDEETNPEEDTAPWRCKVSVEATEEDMGVIQGEVIGDDVFNNILDLNGISESSDFFVFGDPTEFESESQDNRDSDTVTAGDDDTSDKVDAAASVSNGDGQEAEAPATEGLTNDKYTVSETSTRKRVFDKSLLDCWLNDNMEYTVSDKRWRFEFRDELNEFDDLDVMPCDEAMIEVSDCEEGSDIVELPIVDSAVDSDIHVEDSRSILQDSDLQIFPAEEVLEEADQETDIQDIFEAAVTMVNESGEPIDSLDSLMLSDTDLDVEELLKANLKAEPNNNSDDFLSDLLIDLP